MSEHCVIVAVVTVNSLIDEFVKSCCGDFQSEDFSRERADVLPEGLKPRAFGDNGQAAAAKKPNAGLWDFLQDDRRMGGDDSHTVSPS